MRLAWLIGLVGLAGLIQTVTESVCVRQIIAAGGGIGGDAIGDAVGVRRIMAGVGVGGIGADAIAEMQMLQKIKAGYWDLIMTSSRDRGWSGPHRGWSGSLRVG